MHVYWYCALGARVLILSPQSTCTDTEPSVHVYWYWALSARVLILSPQCTCTDTERSVHVYRYWTHSARVLKCAPSQTALQLPQMLAISAHCSTKPQTVHGTQNTLWMCTAIECNLEQKRQCKYNLTVRWGRVTNVGMDKLYVLFILIACVSHLSYPTCKTHCGRSGSTLHSALSYKPQDLREKN